MFIDIKYKQLDYKRKLSSIITYPFYYVVVTPKEAFTSFSSYLISQNTLLNKLKEISEENTLLKTQQLKFDAIQSENNRLHELLNSTALIKEKFLISEIMDVSIDPLGKKFVINKGSNDGVYVGQSVVSSKGVVGQVIDVNYLTSTIILITDSDHAIPLENSRTGMRTLGIGLGSSHELELSNVLKDTDIQKDDLFISSGLGDRFPSGYPVGTVKEIIYENKKPIVRVILKPVVEFDILKEVLLLSTIKEDITSPIDSSDSSKE